MPPLLHLVIGHILTRPLLQLTEARAACHSPLLRLVGMCCNRYTCVHKGADVADGVRQMFPGQESPNAHPLKLGYTAFQGPSSFYFQDP